MNYLDKIRKTLRPLLLATFCFAQLLDALNFSGANVALPRIQEELGFTDGSLQWVISAYALTFGGFLLLTGRLGDVYGHRNFFVIGLLWFAVFAVVSGYSTSSTMMIISRGLQGIGAASTIPNAVALILQNYEPGRSRNQAMSLFASTGAIGFVLGLIIGGVVTQSPLGWRWIFYLSGIIAGSMAVLSILIIPKSNALDEKEETTGEKPKRTIDVFGAALSTSSALLLVYVLTDGNQSGWSNPRIISLLIVAVILMVAFILVELRMKQPLMPMWIWRLPNFGAAFVIACCVAGFFQGYLYYVTLIFQEIFHYSPLQSAIHYLPLGIVAAIMGMSSEKIIYRFNIKRAVMAGLSLGAIGTILLGFYYSEDQYWRIVFPSFVVGVAGLASVYASVSIAAIESAPKSEAGIVGGLLNTAMQIGGGLGLAILTAIDTSVNKPGTSQPDLIKGYHAAIWGGLAVLLVGLFVSIVFLRGDVIQNVMAEERKEQEEDIQTVVQRQMEEGKVGEKDVREEEDNTVIGEEDSTNNTQQETK